MRMKTRFEAIIETAFFTAFSVCITCFTIGLYQLIGFPFGLSIFAGFTVYFGLWVLMFREGFQ